MTILFNKWHHELLARQRVAHFATVNAAGQPSALPVVFAFDGTYLYIPLDGKPKRTSPPQLRRVRDLQQNPQVSLVVDHYDEDWATLAWLQMRGTASIIEIGPHYHGALALLHTRYPQYDTVPLDGHPLIMISPQEIRSWQATPNVQ
jgi:PPOX class probable F420-dependent enzyme